MKFLLVLLVIAIVGILFIFHKKRQKKSINLENGNVRQFVIVNDANEWVSLCEMSCKFTSCDRCIVFRLTEKGNLIVYDKNSPLVYEFGVDEDMNLVVDKCVEYRFRIDNNSRRLILVDDATGNEYFLSNELRFKKSSIGAARIEYVSNLDLFKQIE